MTAVLAVVIMPVAGLQIPVDAAQESEPFSGTPEGLLSVEPSPASDEPSVSTPLEAGAPVLEEWSAKRRTYETDQDGVFVTELFATPVNIMVGGEWLAIETDLKPDAAGLGFASEATPVEVEIADAADADILASVATAGGDAVGFGLEEAEPVQPAVRGNLAEFSSVADGTSLRFEVVPNGIKETIILDSDETPRSFRFPLALDGLAPSIEDGAVVFRDPSGEPQLVIPPGYMEDSASEGSATSFGVSYALIDQGQTLEVRLDAEWLDDPDREFPVLVDPTLVQYAGADDTYVVSGTSANRSQELTLNAGNAFASVTARSFLHFPTGSLTDMSVRSASLSMWQHEAASCSVTPTDVFRVLEPWQGASTTTWPGPEVLEARVATLSSGAGAGGCPSDYVSADLSRLVRDWADGTVDNQGISLRSRSETATSQFKKLTSAQSWVPPKLTVVWVDPSVANAPDLPTDLAPKGATLSASATLGARYVDPQGDVGHVNFHIYDAATGSYMSTASSPQVQSGSVAQVTVPLPLLQRVEWRALAVDEVHSQYSAVTAPMTIERTPAVVSGIEVDDVLTGSASWGATLAPGVTASSVDFLVDGVVVASDSAAPFESGLVSLESIADESHGFAVQLVGGTNGGAISPSVVANVDNHQEVADYGVTEGDPFVEVGNAESPPLEAGESIVEPVAGAGGSGQESASPSSGVNYSLKHSFSLSNLSRSIPYSCFTMVDGRYQCRYVYGYDQLGGNHRADFLVYRRGIVRMTRLTGKGRSAVNKGGAVYEGCRTRDSTYLLCDYKTVSRTRLRSQSGNGYWLKVLRRWSAYTIGNQGGCAATVLESWVGIADTQDLAGSCFSEPFRNPG